MAMRSQAKDLTRFVTPGSEERRLPGAEKLLAAGGLLGALAASSCCLVPLVLFAIGIGGAWIGNLTRLASYQPYFVGIAVVCLGGGYWLRQRAQRLACAEDRACVRPLPLRIVDIGLIVAIVLVTGALAVDFLGPLFL
jgi:mercuric ion transport protein